MSNTDKLVRLSAEEQQYLEGVLGDRIEQDAYLPANETILTKLREAPGVDESCASWRTLAISTQEGLKQANALRETMERERDEARSELQDYKDAAGAEAQEADRLRAEVERLREDALRFEAGARHHGKDAQRLRAALRELMLSERYHLPRTLLIVGNAEAALKGEAAQSNADPDSDVWETARQTGCPHLRFSTNRRFPVEGAWVCAGEQPPCEAKSCGVPTCYRYGSLFNPVPLGNRFHVLELEGGAAATSSNRQGGGVVLSPSAGGDNPGGSNPGPPTLHTEARIAGLQEAASIVGALRDGELALGRPSKHLSDAVKHIRQRIEYWSDTDGDA